MDPSSPLTCITCEFPSADLADLGIGRLLRSTDCVKNVRVRSSTPPQQVRRSPLFPILFGTENTPVFPFSFFGEPQNHPEPQRIQSVTAQFICSEKNARTVAGRLTNLGAVHIRIH